MKSWLLSAQFILGSCLNYTVDWIRSCIVTLLQDQHRHWDCDDMCCLCWKIILERRLLLHRTWLWHLTVFCPLAQFPSVTQPKNCKGVRRVVISYSMWKNHRSEMHAINYFDPIQLRGWGFCIASVCMLHGYDFRILRCYNVANLKFSKNCLHAQLQPQAYSRNILYKYDHLILYIWWQEA